VRGVIHVKDILRTITTRGTITEDMIRPATFVAESASVEVVVAAMRRSQTQMTIVMDEHGGMAGILTIEDLFEEVVGEIGESAKQLADVEYDGRGRFRVLGTTRIAEVGEALHMALSHPRVDTVSGLVLTLLGRPAQVGDRVEHDGVALEVTAVHGRGVAECIASCAPVRDESSAEVQEKESDDEHPPEAGRAARPDTETMDTLRDAVEVEAQTDGVLGTPADRPSVGAGG
jgi:CBS domain containing-hemolysin-like protein